MPTRHPPSTFAFDLADPETARAIAQDIADKVGRDIVVTDKDGNEVCKVLPIRRNELTVRPKILN